MTERIVVLGFMSHFPVAGVAWQTIHYLVGFQRLGYEVFYVEAHGCTPSKLMQSEDDDGPMRAASYIDSTLRRFDLHRNWAYVARYEDGRGFGIDKARLHELLRSATFIVNLHGSHLPTEELTASNRLVYLGTDPVDIEVEVQQQKKETLEYLAAHCAFFTFGENIGKPHCRVPAPTAFTFRPTRQPVVMDFWENHGSGAGDAFTTIGNWRQPWRPVKVNGETLRWSKDLEWQKFVELPRRVPQTFELALSSHTPADQRRLEEHGWRVRAALELSGDLDTYRAYIGSSRGEFTVAKEQNVRLCSGWFSDRAATYLAAGRPVVTQETGFSHVLPTGEGLFAYSTMEQAVDAVNAVNADYERHRRAARAIAREYLGHEVVLGRLLEDLGATPPAARTHSPAASSSLPPELVLVPVSRWPTRLPEATVVAALALPTPPAPSVPPSSGPRASVIVVTHQGLPFTKMCLTSLLGNTWRAGDELIVVDNGSSDGTRAYLQDLAGGNPSARVVCNERNLGFAAANNQGLALATGDVLVLLNNDTIVPRGWRDGLLRLLEDRAVGLAGPVTNRTCNEAQIDAPYRTYSEFEVFARERAERHTQETTDLPMLAMFCLAMRRDVFEQVGPLDEQFGIGMFEDDDYARRVQQAGFRVVCAEGVFVHHFGQASLGELCTTGDYDRILEGNRRRFEAKWGEPWRPHARRITSEYQALRERIRASVRGHVPADAKVLVVSKGDDELLEFSGRSGWHFPRAADGRYANEYPADSASAIAQLEASRAQGATFLVIPKTGLWWLDFYTGLREHLETHYRLAFRDAESCSIFDLGNGFKPAASSPANAGDNLRGRGGSV